MFYSSFLQIGEKTICHAITVLGEFSHEPEKKTGERLIDKVCLYNHAGLRLFQCTVPACSHVWKLVAGNTEDYPVILVTLEAQ